jgi:hypothetical protein
VSGGLEASASRSLRGWLITDAQTGGLLQVSGTEFRLFNKLLN